MSKSIADLNFEEMQIVLLSQEYKLRFVNAHVSNRDMFLLIAKLVEIIDYLEDIKQEKEIVIKKVVYDSSAKCWRDIYTGVKIEI